MMPMLQTSPDFPSWATSSALPDLQRQEAMVRQNESAEYLQQWTPTEITDADGKRWFVLAKPAGESQGAAAWNLYSLTAGRWRIRPGRIFANPSDLTQPIEIGGTNDEINFSSGHVVWIDLSMQPDGAYTLALRSGSKQSWNEDEKTPFPEAYQITTPKEPDEIPVFQKAKFLLWSLESGRVPTGDAASVQFTRDLYGTPVRRSADLCIFWTARTFDDDTRRRGLVPALIGL